MTIRRLRLTFLAAASDEGGLDLEKRVGGRARRLIRKALAATGDDKAKAARLLKISERTLRHKLNRTYAQSWTNRCRSGLSPTYITRFAENLRKSC
ncbi:helix-turn-helix domain-containing protein [Methylomagnum sp.]